MSRAFPRVYCRQCLAAVTAEQRLCRQCGAHCPAMGAFRYAFSQVELGAVLWIIAIVIVLFVILWMEHFA